MPPNDPSSAESLAVDRLLAERCLAGDESAMQALVERHEGMVMRLCVRMLGHLHDAEDVAQETFVRALRSLKRWDPARRFEPWLLAIAANRCRTALARRKPAWSNRQPLAEQLAAPPESRPALGQLAEEVALALDEVREDYRQAFELFHHQQLTYAEIADVLQVPVGTVKTWIHRARREVASRLIRRGVVETAESNEVRHALPSDRTATARVAG